MTTSDNRLTLKSLADRDRRIAAFESPYDAQRRLIEYMLTLTDEERLSIINNLVDRFCLHCGRIEAGGRCQCWNDD